MTMAKEFSWDKEGKPVVVEDGAKQRHQVRLCELKGVPYVSIATEKFYKAKDATKEAWHVTSAKAFKQVIFTDIVDNVERMQVEVAAPASLRKTEVKPKLAGLIQRDEKGMPVKEKTTKTARSKKATK